MTTEKILDILHYPRPILSAIAPIIPNIADLANSAYSGTDLDHPITAFSPVERLAAITYLLAEKYSAYQSKGIASTIIEDTFLDVTLRAEQYFAATGQPGLSADDAVWFRHIMNIEIFRLGALQFQPFRMLYLDEQTLGEPYMVFRDSQKQLLPPGSPVINCHIPANAELQPKNVLASFQRAKRLFSMLYPGVPFKAFLCYSWLLYPDMQKLLRSDSNIKKFAGLFNILSACQDPSQAFENLHGTTSLSIAAQASPKSFGYACGIIPLDASFLP